MIVRGAPLIGAAAAYGMALAMAQRCLRCRADPAYTALMASRPTAVNLRWALDDLRSLLCAAAAGQAGRRRLPARRRDLRRGCRDLPRASARTASALIKTIRPKGRPHQCPDPLQRRLARHRRLGHRAGADLPGAQRRHPDPCLGRRDAAAQPGRQPDRLGTRQARRAAHRDRRQCRRPSDAARPGRLLHRRHRPHDAPRRRLQQDRHLPEGAGRARQRRAVLCRPALSHHRLDDRGRTRHPDRGAPRQRGLAHRRPHRLDGDVAPSTCCPRAARPPIPPSTSRRRGW